MVNISWPNSMAFTFMLTYAACQTIKNDRHLPLHPLGTSCHAVLFSHWYGISEVVFGCKGTKSAASEHVTLSILEPLVLKGPYSTYTTKSFLPVNLYMIFSYCFLSHRIKDTFKTDAC